MIEWSIYILVAVWTIVLAYLYRFASVLVPQLMSASILRYKKMPPIWTKSYVICCVWWIRIKWAGWKVWWVKSAKTTQTWLARKGPIQKGTAICCKTESPVENLAKERQLLISENFRLKHELMFNQEPC